MNMNLKGIFICVTNHNTWGKGYTVEEAKKNARLAKGKQVQYYVQAAMYNDPTEVELGEAWKCITVNSIDGSPMYDFEGEDETTKAIVKAKHVGWVTVQKP
jgi:hypothetical protein